MSKASRKAEQARKARARRKKRILAGIILAACVCVILAVVLVRMNGKEKDGGAAADGSYTA